MDEPEWARLERYVTQFVVVTRPSSILSKALRKCVPTDDFLCFAAVADVKVELMSSVSDSRPFKSPEENKQDDRYPLLPGLPAWTTCLR